MDIAIVVAVGAFAAVGIWIAIMAIKRSLTEAQRHTIYQNAAIEIARVSGRLDGITHDLDEIRETTKRTFFQAAGLSGRIERSTVRAMEPFNFHAVRQAQIALDMMNHVVAYRADRHNDTDLIEAILALAEENYRVSQDAIQYVIEVNGKNAPAIPSSPAPEHHDKDDAA